MVLCGTTTKDENVCTYWHLLAIPARMTIRLHRWDEKAGLQRDAIRSR